MSQSCARKTARPTFGEVPSPPPQLCFSSINQRPGAVRLHRHRICARTLAPLLSPLTVGHLGHFQFLTVINTQPHRFFAQACAQLRLWHFSPLSESDLWRCLSGAGQGALTWHSPRPGTGKSKDSAASHPAPAGARSACVCGPSPCRGSCLIKGSPSKFISVYSYPL